MVPLRRCFSALAPRASLATERSLTKPQNEARLKHGTQNNSNVQILPRTAPRISEPPSFHHSREKKSNEFMITRLGTARTSTPTRISHCSQARPVSVSRPAWTQHFHTSIPIMTGETATLPPLTAHERQVYSRASNKMEYFVRPHLTLLFQRSTTDPVFHAC